MKRFIFIILFLLLACAVFAESDMLNQVTAKLIEYVENAEAFLTEQTPEYIEQLLRFKLYTLKLWFVFMITLATSFLFLAIYCLIKAVTDDDEYFIEFYVLVFIIIVFVIFSIGFFLDLKQIELAPKVFILEYLMRLR